MRENELPNYLYYDDIPEDIKENLIEIESNPRRWMKLLMNKNSGQLWAVDVWDKYVWQVAFKIKDKKDWKENDYTEYRKKLLLKCRGGLQKRNCIVEGCVKNRVKGVVYCIDHLYETGARK